MKCLDSVALDGIEETPEGYLKAFAKTARTGVQTYRRSEVGLTGDGTVNIFRPEAQVFDKSSLESFTNLPITMDHPANGVSADNFRSEAIGVTTGDVMRDGEHVRFGLKIMDKEAVERIKAGKRQLSGGYDHDIDWTAGITADGIPYDGSQINIRGNHIAVVDNGRAGSARIGDAAPAEQWGAAPVTTQDKGTPMLKKFTIDGVTLETTAESAVDMLQDKLKSRDTAITSKDAEIASLTSKVETLTGENETLKKEVEDSAVTPETLNQMAADRATVMGRYKAITSKDADPSATTAEIKRAAVKHHVGDAAANWSDDAVSGSFDTIRVNPLSNLGPLKANDHKQNDSMTKDTADVLKRAGVAMRKES